MAWQHEDIAGPGVCLHYLVSPSFWVDTDYSLGTILHLSSPVALHLYLSGHCPPEPNNGFNSWAMAMILESKWQ